MLINVFTAQNGHWECHGFTARGYGSPPEISAGTGTGICQHQRWNRSYSSHGPSFQREWWGIKKEDTFAVNFSGKPQWGKLHKAKSSPLNLLKNFTTVFRVILIPLGSVHTHPGILWNLAQKELMEILNFSYSEARTVFKQDDCKIWLCDVKRVRKWINHYHCCMKCLMSVLWSTCYQHVTNALKQNELWLVLPREGLCFCVPFSLSFTMYCAKLCYIWSAVNKVT